MTARLRLHTQAPTAAPTPAPTAAAAAAKAPAAGPQAPPPPLIAFAIEPTAGAGKSTNISEHTLARLGIKRVRCARVVALDRALISFSRRRGMHRQWYNPGPFNIISTVTILKPVSGCVWPCVPTDVWDACLQRWSRCDAIPYNASMRGQRWRSTVQHCYNINEGMHD